LAISVVIGSSEEYCGLGVFSFLSWLYIQCRFDNTNSVSLGLYPIKL